MQTLFFLLLGTVCLVDVPVLIKSKSKVDTVFFFTVAAILIVLGAVFLAPIDKISISRWLIRLFFGGDKT